MKVVSMYKGSDNAPGWAIEVNSLADVRKVLDAFEHGVLSVNDTHELFYMFRPGALPSVYRVGGWAIRLTSNGGMFMQLVSAASYAGTVTMEEAHKRLGPYRQWLEEKE